MDLCCPDLVSIQLWFLRCLCVVACFLPGRLLGLLTTFFLCASPFPPSLSSSTIEVIGSFSWLVLPYSPILVKLGETPSHLRRCRLISRSNPSTVEVAISYSIRGHKNLGNRPCWYNHALNLPGSSVLSISFKPSWSWFLVLLMLFVSFRLTSYHFPRHLIGLSIIDGISSPCTSKFW